MLMLSKNDFEKAKKQILKHGIPIEKAWFQYNFENESTKEFIRVLSEYQYENGGFGGLSHEYAYKGPCLISTKYAFDYIYELNERPKTYHPMIQSMMKYVLQRYRPEEGCWGDLFVPEINDDLHVEWESYEGNHKSFDNHDERLRHYSPNRQASLAAFVALYSELVPKDLYNDIIKYPKEKILWYYDKNSSLKGTDTVDKSIDDETKSPYNMKCYQKFCDCLKDKVIAHKLKAILLQNPTACMELDSTLWDKGYYETACDVVTNPKSFLYATVKKEVDASLDALIQRQSDDGVWYLTWSFGNSEGLKKLQAKYEIKSTLSNLIVLKRYQRIEN